MSFYGPTRLYYILIAVAVTIAAGLSFNQRNVANKSPARERPQTYQQRSPRPLLTPPRLMGQNTVVENTPAPLRPAQLNLSVASTSAPQTQSPEVFSSWDFSGSDLNPRNLAYFFQNNEPSQIFFFTVGGTEIFQPAHGPGHLGENVTEAQRIFFVSSPDVIQRIIADREQMAHDRTESRAPNTSGAPSEWPPAADDTTTPAQNNSPEISASDSPETPKSEEPPLVKISESAFEIELFKAGRRDSGETLIPAGANLRAALQGPDYSLEAFNHSDEKLMRQNLSRILSMGNGGELILSVAQNGFLLDGPGFDFALFENALTLDRSLNIWQEFGLVGVSESSAPESFRWFPCDPQNSVLIGCLGSVPTAQGGDQFDLAELGLKKIRYIWIKDLGINKNLPSRWPTEGCDLDAVRLYHAYTQ